VNVDAEVREICVDTKVWNRSKPSCNQADASSDKLIAWIEHQLSLMCPPIHAATEVIVVTVVIEMSQESPDDP